MTGSVHVGLYLPQIRMPFATIVERAQAAEAAGFDSVWFMDHLWAPADPTLDTLEGWTVATAVAARTSSIRIGHLVLCDAFRPPVLLAKMAATLDVISGGRLELGIGWGSVPSEIAAAGLGADPPAVRAGRLEETLLLLERLFTGEPVSFDGRFHRVEGAICRPVPLQAPLPVHIGGAGRSLTLPLVRRFASWWNIPSYAVDRLAELRPLAGGARVSVQHPVALVHPGDDRDAVVATATRRFAGWGGLLCGSTAELAAALAAEMAEGVEGFVLQFSDFGRPESVQRFGEEVLPVLRAEAGASRSGVNAAQ